MRRLILLALLCVLLVPQTQSAPALNVLFIISDDLRDHIGCYGHEVAKTPNIDRLAERGVRFERAYVQYPICNPSRNSFLTGLRPSQTGITDNSVLLRSKLPDAVTLPQLFKESGWHTAAFGKIFHLGGGRDEAAQAQWMDLPKSWHQAETFRATAAGYNLEGRNLTEGKLRWCAWGATAGSDDDQPDGQNARAAIALIEQQREQPWFLAVGFHRPHDPFIAPKKYFDLYPPESLRLHRDPAAMTAAPPLAVGFGAFGESFRAFSDQERLEFLRAYYACVSFMDAQVGRLLEALDRNQLWDRTIVVFLSDHGYHLGERDWWNKNTLFERSCRTPLIIAAPGVKPGVARGLVEFVDLYPTLAGLCGLRPPPGLVGQSLRLLLDDPSRPGKSAAFTLVKRGAAQRGDSIRTDRWRYIEWSDGTRELYDHQTDPEENQNLVEKPDHQEAIAELSRRLRANAR